MAIRTQGRAKFDYNGRSFVWWVHQDTYLRIASADKQFVVSYVLYDPDSVGPLLAVLGPEFPGIARTEPRPMFLVPPKLNWECPMGRHVADILDWCFQSDGHQPFAGVVPSYAVPVG